MTPEEYLILRNAEVQGRLLMKQEKREIEKINERERRREYNKRPEVKARLAAHHKRPGVMERKKEYSKKYYSRPEVKARRKEYDKEYVKRPEVKEMLKAYRKKYYAIPAVRKKQSERCRKNYLQRKAEDKQ